MTRIALTALAVLFCASLAQAGIVDPGNSYATINNPGILTITPGNNGDQQSLTDPNDNVIHVWVNDAGGNPVEIVATDIWLQNDSAVPCPGGWFADSTTYAPDPGHTTFSLTPLGGVYIVPPNEEECENELTKVIAVGQVIQNDIDLRFKSPDLNGDGQVTSIDFGLFGAAYNKDCTPIRWCADLDRSHDTYVAGEDCVTAADFGKFGTLYYNDSVCP